MARTIAIGDIHGCSLALDAVIASIGPQPDDTIIPLGDYVDRGIDSKGVIDRLIKLQERCKLIPILGNHDEMMLSARQSKSAFQMWLNCGGDSALDSYGSNSKLSLIPEAHWQFLQCCRSYYESANHVFVHGNYKPEVPVDQLLPSTLRWLSLRDYVPNTRHCSGKTFFVGHTPQIDVLDLEYLVCIDTKCWKAGWLTAIDVDSRQVWQANEQGKLREAVLESRG
ncbi:MAG: metallophosphoesterase family protein [Pirellulales bacterium]